MLVHPGLRRALLLSSMLGATACRSTEAPDVRLVDAARSLPSSAFPGASALLDGFDPLAADDAWRAGDEVLYGLRLLRAGHARHWLLHLRLTEPLAIARANDEVGAGELLPPVEWSIRINDEPQAFGSRLCRVIATVTDAAGVVLGRSEPLLPRDFLQRGFSTACQLVQQRLDAHPETRGSDEFYTGMDVRPLAEATVCTVALLQVVQEDDVLAPLLWHVVQRPSIWSVVANLGARVVLRPRFHAAAEAPSPVAGAGPGPVWRVPMNLMVNDTLALQVEMLVGGAVPPFALCGGMLGATAHHPMQAGTEFSLILLGARRGPSTPGASSR
ncbi:MAG: hypothetical protein ABIP94_02965 [Planctomycetota bacterium]